MEFGEMKRNTSNWSNFCMLLRRASLTASAGLSCSYSLTSMNAWPTKYKRWFGPHRRATRLQLYLSLFLSHMDCFTQKVAPLPTYICTCLHI